MATGMSRKTISVFPDSRNRPIPLIASFAAGGSGKIVRAFPPHVYGNVHSENGRQLQSRASDVRDVDWRCTLKTSISSERGLQNEFPHLQRLIGIIKPTTNFPPRDCHKALESSAGTVTRCILEDSSTGNNCPAALHDLRANRACAFLSLHESKTLHSAVRPIVCLLVCLLVGLFVYQLAGLCTLAIAALMVGVEMLRRTILTIVAFCMILIIHKARNTGPRNSTSKLAREKT